MKFNSYFKMLLPGVAAVVMASCSPKQKDNTATAADSTAKATEQTVAQPAEPTAAAPPAEAVKAFFLWLEKNGEVIDERVCFTQDELDVTGVDKACTEKYLTGLKATGYFSESYIKLMRDEFARMESEIKKDKVTYGRDYDYFTQSQDPPTIAQLVTATEKNPVVSINGNTATVLLELERPFTEKLKYYLELEDNKWKIAKVEASE